MSDLIEGLRQLVRDEAGSLLTKATDKESLKKELSTVEKRSERVDLAVDIFRNDGFADPKASSLMTEEERKAERFTLTELMDALGPTDIPLLMPKVVSTVVQEAVEPIMVLSALFSQVRYQGTQITFPSVGGMYAADIAPGQEYPAQELDMAGYITAQIGKSGLMVRFTDEVIRYSVFDVIGLHLRAAGRALARLKEVKVAQQILATGSTSFDNSGGTALHGKTTGRGMDLNGNNTMTIDDIFTMYADLINAGFVPNTFLVNPIGWLVFARHSTLREWAFWGTKALYQTPEGSPGFIGPRGANMGPSRASGSTERNINQQTTYGAHPSELFPANLGMVVSPWIPYNSGAGTTDIILCDRNELGVMVTDQPPTTERWDDPARDIQAIKIMERYGLAISNEGEGVTVARGVSTAKGFDWENLATASHNLTGDLPPIV